jgi:hypothetical protein
VKIDLETLRRSYWQNPEIQQTVAPSLKKLESLSTNAANAPIAEQVRVAIANMQENGDLAPLAIVLTEAKSKIVGEEELDKTYKNQLEEAANDVKKVLSLQSSAIFELSSSLEKIKSLIPALTESLEKPDNRVAEIAKRIALGVIVCSFFLAILRYVAGIYRSYNNQVIRADYDDLAVRRFYIAYKGSHQSPDVLKSVLAEFIRQPSFAAGQESAAADELSKAGVEFVKEFMKNLAKKGPP